MQVIHQILKYNAEFDIRTFFFEVAIKVP